MKRLLIILLLTIFYNGDTIGQSKINTDKEIIDNFIKDIIFDDGKSYKDYLDIFDGSEKDKAKIIEIVDFVILAYKNSIEFRKWKDYKIVPYSEFENHSIIISSNLKKNWTIKVISIMPIL